jgi:hypothetical protein
MTDNTIDEPNRTIKQFPVAPAVNDPLANPPRSPLQSPDPKIRLAWQVALSTLRKKNRAGRPPLA